MFLLQRNVKKITSLSRRLSEHYKYLYNQSKPTKILHISTYHEFKNIYHINIYFKNEALSFINYIHIS